MPTQRKSPRRIKPKSSRRPPHPGTKARTVGDRPRVRHTKPVLKKESETAHSETQSIPKRPLTHLRKRNGVPANRPKFGRSTFIGKKKFPAHKSGKSNLPLKLVKKSAVAANPELKREESSLNGTIRLNKYISNAGLTSRRKADELITQGVVMVNGKVIKELGVQVKPFEDIITVNGEMVSIKSRHIYLLLNKPKDTITTTSDEKDRSTVLDYINFHERVYPIGRLDRNTTGVLLLTNDGELTNRLTHPSSEIEREYHVTLDRRLEFTDVRKLSDGGLDIGEGEVTGPIEVSAMENPNEVMLRLREGKNREVRRIFETLGYEVEKLDRTSFAGITHRGMGRGDSRPLTNQEVHHIKSLAGIEK